MPEGIYEQDISQYHPQPNQRRLSDQGDDTLEPDPVDWLVNQRSKNSEGFQLL